MPTYTSQCRKCGSQRDFYSTVANRDDTPQCCGQQTLRTIAAPMVGAMSFTGHKGLHLPDGKNGGQGTWIESGDAYKRYLKENNKVVASEGFQEADIQRKRQA